MQLRQHHTIRRRHLLVAGLMAALLAACSGVEVHNINVQTAAKGTEIEARQVVALIYAQAPDSEIDTLLYSGGDLSRAVKRLRDRHPRLKPWLDRGAVGNTASGFVARREPGEDGKLNELIREENRDRAFLYNQASAAVGHGGDNLNAWLPYASYTFGQEWIGQGAAGWWAADPDLVWRQR